MLLLLGQDHFSVEKMHKFNVFNECVTRPTDQPMDRAYYRDERTHLKTEGKKKEEEGEKEKTIETERTQSCFGGAKAIKEN